MRSKVKVTSKEEILKNFTREFLLEEKKRCEIDRYVTDFRILIHRRPHENHNYFNRLLQDYTSMFLSHERISVNKSNEGEMKHRLMKQLASKMKESPKQRYVKSKSSSKNSETSERQSYLILKAKTAEFLLQLKKYDELEQIAYELFAKHSNNQYSNEMKFDPTRNYSDNPENHILKLKTVEFPLEIPYKKTYKHVYVVNTPETRHVIQGSPDNKVIFNSKNSPALSTRNLLKNYEYVKNETFKFLENTKNYNDAEQKILSEQYRLNIYIKKYVDNLNSCNKDTTKSNSPKKSLFNKIRNMMGFAPENSNKTHKNRDEKPLILKQETMAFLENEKNFNNFEFLAYQLYYTKNEKFENPLIEYNRDEMHGKIIHTNNDILLEELPDNEKVHHNLSLSKLVTTSKQTPKDKKINDENVESSNSENNQQYFGVMNDIEFNFNPTTHHPEDNKIVLKEISPIEFEANVNIVDEYFLEKSPEQQTELVDQHNRILKQKTEEFLLLQKKYEDDQHKFYVMFINKHPNYITGTKNKRESLLYKIKQLFNFGKSEKYKENPYYFKKLTDEFLRNERYYYDQEQNAVVLIKRRPTDLYIDTEYEKDTSKTVPKTPDFKTENLSPMSKKQNKKFKLSPSVLHQRSRSDDLLTLKSKSKSLDNTKKSPTGHKSLSDRIKRMVGIGHHKRTKSRENILHLTDPVQYFLYHEKFFYDGEPNPKLYSRSASLLNQPGKTNTLRRKNDNFFSSENIPHQDQNDGVTNKPPSGRSRQERRSEGGKSKTRSRTLSPAQKLVSKFRSIMQREDKNKEDKASWELLRNETEKFLKDQKTFVEIYRVSSSNGQFQKFESNCEEKKNNGPIMDEKNEMDEYHPNKQILAQNQIDSSNIIEQKSSKQKTETSSAGTHINSDALTTDLSNNSYYQSVYDKVNPHEINNFPMKSASTSDNRESVPNNTEFFKYQTKKFLHNMKKYNDFDKTANDVNKTLIFVNNKTSTPKDIFTVNAATGEAVHKEIEDMQHSISNHEKQEECTMNKNIPNQFSQQKFTVPLTSHNSIKSPEKCEEHSKERSLPETIKCRTFKKEEVTTRRVISKNIQTNPITISTTKEIFLQNQQNDVSTQENNTETEKNLKNESKEKHIEDRNLTLLGKMHHSFTKKSGEMHDNERDNDPQSAFIISPKQLSSKREDIPKKNGSFSASSETNSKRRLIMSDNKSGKLLRNQSEEIKSNQCFSAEKDVIPSSSINIEKKVVHSNMKGFQSTLPAENVNERQIIPKTAKENSNFEKKPEIIDSDISAHTEENNQLIRKQTAEFLNYIKKHNNEMDSSKKSKIFWLSEQKIIPRKFEEIHQENHSSMYIQGSKSERHDHNYVTHIFNKKQTEVFLKDLKTYHDKQRIEYNEFSQKLSKPHNKFELSTNIPKKHKLANKIKKSLSPTASKKIQYSTDGIPYLLSMNQTAEFLKRNQYIIHEKEMNFDNSSISNDSYLREHAGIPNVTSDHSMPKNIVQQKLPSSIAKTKGSTISNTKSCVGSILKPSQPEKEHELIKQHTTEFLEDLRTYNNKIYETTKYEILILNENKMMSRKVGELRRKNISSNKINECSDENDTKGEEHRFLKAQNVIFLKDHKNYHDKQRNEDNKFYQKVRKPENELWLSTNNKKENAIVQGIENLISPTFSNKLHHFIEGRTHIQLMEQTSEFLDKNQYLIHKEEINLKNTYNTENQERKKETHLLKVRVNQLKQPKVKLDQTFPHTKKQKKSTFSKIKSLMASSDKQLPGEKDHILIKNQTTEFLENLKCSTNLEYEVSSKSKIIWLNENTSLPLKVDDIPQKNRSTKLERIYENVEKAHNIESFALVKEHTNTFLKEHKDYHDKQRNEDNKFYQKMGKPDQKLWLSSNNENKNFIMRKIEKFISPLVSKKHNSDVNTYALMRDQTGKFLDRNQYLIHEQEIKFKNTHNLEAVEREADLFKETANQLTQPKDKLEQTFPHTTKKQKKTTFSKIKSLMGSSHKQLPDKKDHILIKNQTIKFLENLKNNTKKEYEIASKSKIIWLKKNEIFPQKADEIPQRNLSTEVERIFKKKEKAHDIEAFALIQQHNSTFLKKHKDYHDRQRNEENKFYQKVGKSEQKLWLSSNNEKKNVIVKKIGKLISPLVSKKLQNNKDVHNNALLRDQTTEFLDKNKYLIHEQEIKFKTTHNSEGAEKRADLLKVTANQITQSEVKLDQTFPVTKKQRKSTFFKIKSLMSNSHKQLPDDKDSMLIKNQTIEFLEDLRNNTNKEYKVSSRSKIMWLNENVILPQNVDEISQQNLPVKIEKLYGNVENAQDIESFAIIKEHTNTFLKEHKDYHNRQRNEDNKFYQKVGKPEQKLWLSFNNEKKNFIVRKIAKLVSPLVSEKLHHNNDVNNYALLRDQTTEFLDKNQYLIHEQEREFKETHNSEAAEKQADLLKVTVSQLTQPKVKLDETFPHFKKQEKITSSEIKSLMSSNHKQLPVEKDYILIRSQTIKFLEDFKNNTNKEYEISSRSKILWLNENVILPRKVDEISQRNPSTKIGKIYGNEENAPNSKDFASIKEQNHTFLEEHKDYHHKQRNEDNSFPQKTAKLEQKHRLSSNNEKKNLSVPKIEELVSSAVSKTPQHHSIEKSLLLREKSHIYIKQQTTEFLENVRIFNNKAFGSFSRHKIPWLAEKGADQQVHNNSLQSGTFKKDIRREESIHTVRETETDSCSKQQTANFLNDHKNYHDKKRNEPDVFFRRDCKSEGKNTSSSHTPNPKGLKIRMKKLLSQPQSKQSLVIYNDENYQYLLEQTANFISNHQYLIHKEEVNFKPTSTYADLPDKPKIKTEKVKNTLSKIKSAISGAPKQRRESNYELINAQTSEFLKNLKEYNNIQYESSSKFKVSWLNETNTISQNQNEVALKNISELRTNATAIPKGFMSLKSGIAHDNECELVSQGPIEKFEKQNFEKMSFGSTIGKNNSEYESNLIHKQKTDNFLKDLKTYHNNQRIQDNKFYQKMGKPEEKFWLSSTDPTKNRLVNKIKKLLSPTLSKKSHHCNEENSYLIKDKTAEFLDRNQYLIHEEELNHKFYPIDKSVKEETGLSNVTPNQLSVPRETLTCNTQKRGTLSKIKSLMTRKRNPPVIKERNTLVRKQTADFLEYLKEYYKKESEIISKEKIVWLCDREIMSQKISETNISAEVFEENRNEEKNTDYQKYILIKKQTDTFLKNHQYYHDKQRIEDNRFFQKFCGAEVELELLTNIPKRNDRTSRFLNENEYSIYEEVMNPTNLINNANHESREVVNQLEETLSAMPRKEYRKEIENTKKSSETKTTDKHLVDDEDRIINKKASEFSADLKKYNNSQYETSSKFQTESPSDSEIISKNPNEPIQETTQNIMKGREFEKENQDDKLNILKETDNFLRDHTEYHNRQWNYYKCPQKVKISEQKLSVSSNTRTNDQKQPQTIKKKVTFSDYQEYNENENACPEETDNFKTIKETTQSFLKKSQDYHNEQWKDYRRFHQEIPKDKEKYPPNITCISSPILLKAKYIDSLHSPKKTNSSNDEKASKEIRDLSMKFLKKQQYFISEGEIEQNKMKPKPSPRKSKTSQEKLSKLNNSHEVYLLTMKSVIRFLQENQSYHNKERNELINFTTKKMEHNTQNRNNVEIFDNFSKINCPKESKSRFKLMSKLKSLVEGSTEIFSPDNRRKENELKKQTAEFLISQKCFWDLQKTAEITFAEEKHSIKYHKQTITKVDYSKNLLENNFVSQVEKKKECKLEKLPLKMIKNNSDNSIPQSHNENQNNKYEILKRKNQLFLNDHKTYHNTQKEDFIAFSVRRKQNHNESPSKDKNFQNTIPQNSSKNQKTLEMENSTKNQIESRVQIKQNNASEPIQNICEVFLNNQRYYIDSANEGWRRYVMYKPEVAIFKRKISKNKSSNSKERSVSKITPKLNNLHYSGTEGQKIDYEVNLHKTKLFLENQKRYHDNQHNAFSKYVPTNINKNNISEPQTGERKDGVLDKIRSLGFSSHNKILNNMQKQKLASDNQKEIIKNENEPVITKFVEQPDLIRSKTHGEDVPKIILKEQTDLFLKDHQHYHNRLHDDFIKYFGNKNNELQISVEEESAKNKKAKKSMMSKIKSLLGSDSSKKSKNKKINFDDFFKTPTKLFLEDQIQYSHIEKSAEKIFNESKANLKLRNFKSTPIDPARNVIILKYNEKGPSIENNGQHVELQSNDQQKEVYPVNKIALGTNKRACNIPEIQMSNINETSTTDKNTINPPNLAVYDNEISDEIAIPLLNSAMSNISKNEKKNYAREKLQTHEFLLSQKQLASAEKLHNSNSDSEPLQCANTKTKSIGITHEGILTSEGKNIERNSSTRNDEEIISSFNSENIKPIVATNIEGSFIQPTYENANFTKEEKDNIDSSLVQRVERPMSPTKIIFKELRTKDNSPDKRVYILSEGYTITKEVNEGERKISTNEIQSKQHEPITNECISQENTSYFKHSAITRVKNQDAEKILATSHSRGQDSTSDSNEYSPSQRISQGDLAVGQHSKRRTYREMEEEPRSFIAEARIENYGDVTQRYTTSCYFHQVPTAVWYSESLIIDLEEKSRKLHEKAYYANQLQPDYWSETFETEITSKEKMYTSEAVISISQESDHIQYISLENQQEKSLNQIVCNDE